MNDRVEVRVIIIMDMRGDAIQQSSMLRIREKASLMAEDGGRGRSEERAQGFLLWIWSVKWLLTAYHQPARGGSSRRS